MRSHSRKLARAREHLDVLNQEIEGYVLDPEAYGVTPEVNSDRTEHRFRAWVAKEPDPAWGVLMGDILHNARGCLDNLVWELCHPGLRDIYTGFPIFFKGTGYWERQKNNGPPTKRSGYWKVRGLASEPRTMIEGYQPYNRWYFRSEHPLWVLHEMSNMDKHQTMHLGLVFPQQTSLTLGQGTVIAEPTFGPVEDQAVVLTLRVPPQDTDPTVGMKLTFTFDVAFVSEGFMYGWIVRQTVLDIVASAVGIVAELDPFVPPAPRRHLGRPPRFVEVTSGPRSSS